MFFNVFANAGFRYFEALDGSLRPILAPLGPIWSKTDPLHDSKSCPKSAPKLVQKMPPKITNKLPIWGPEMDSKMGQDAEPGAQANQDGGL